jgi:hypothetical protein
MCWLGFLQGAINQAVYLMLHLQSISFTRQSCCQETSRKDGSCIQSLREAKFEKVWRKKGPADSADSAKHNHHTE